MKHIIQNIALGCGSDALSSMVAHGVVSSEELALRGRGAQCCGKNLLRFELVNF